MSIKVEKKDRSEAIKGIIEKIKKLKVYVGIPEAETARRGEPINNAQLCYIHTHGSPVRHIPPRPIIEPAIKAEGNKERITTHLKKAAEATLEGNEPEARNELELAGMEAQNVSRAWFVDPRNNWKPNSEITVAMKGSDKPLIDTGQLRKSITYVIIEE